MWDANRKIVDYIKTNWVIPYNNNSKFANDHNIDEKTVRRIREDENYTISLKTIIRICESRDIYSSITGDWGSVHIGIVRFLSRYSCHGLVVSSCTKPMYCVFRRSTTCLFAMY